MIMPSAWILMHNMIVMFLPVYCGLFGLMFGSFSNVLVYRLPRGESVVFPSSHCPVCDHDIAWYDNIPVLSFLFLKGHCRHCQADIAIRYPILELTMGISWAFMGWHFGWSAELCMALVLTSILWVLTWIDLETFLLPDVITLPGILIGIGFGFWLGYGMESVIGAVAGYGVFWLVAITFLKITGREGMGYGDFKLLAMLGAFLGWHALPWIIFLASLSGAVIGTLYLLRAGKGMQSQLPFGPYLAMAGMVWLLWGESWVRWYIS